MADRSVLITGCSSGIGLDAARRLHADGWQVIASCRQEQDAARLRGEGLDCLRIDYADETSVADGAAAALDRTGGRLYAVFNNGAHAIPGAVEDLSRDALRHIFETNLFGPFDLTRRLLPAMRAAGRGRVVNCSSVLGFATTRVRGAYCATKHAMESLSDALRLETRGSGIHVCLIEPGPIRTAFRANALAQFRRWIDVDGSAHRDLYLTQALPRMQSDAPAPGEKPPAAVTERLLHALTAANPRPRYFVTRTTWIASAADRLLPTRAMDYLLKDR